MVKKYNVSSKTIKATEAFQHVVARYNKTLRDADINMPSFKFKISDYGRGAVRNINKAQLLSEKKRFERFLHSAQKLGDITITPGRLRRIETKRLKINAMKMEHAKRSNEYQIELMKARNDDIDYDSKGNPIVPVPYNAITYSKGVKDMKSMKQLSDFEERLNEAEKKVERGSSGEELKRRLLLALENVIGVNADEFNISEASGIIEFIRNELTGFDVDMLFQGGYFTFDVIYFLQMYHAIKELHILADIIAKSPKADIWFDKGYYKKFNEYISNIGNEIPEELSKDVNDLFDDYNLVNDIYNSI